MRPISNHNGWISLNLDFTFAQKFIFARTTIQLFPKSTCHQSRHQSHTSNSLSHTASSTSGKRLSLLPSYPRQPLVSQTAFDKEVLVTNTISVSGFASNIYFPALPVIADDFNVSTELINLTVTSYLVFQGLAPSFWGPVSDVRGRRTAYTATFIVFVAACIGLAVARNYATLIVLRCLQSAGSASTISIGSGVIGDITTRAERGGFMGVFQAGLLVPVAVGPIIGGALAGSLGWRSVFWFLAIYGAIFLIALVVLLPETLRSIVSNGSLEPENAFLKHPLRTYQNHTSTQYSASTTELPKRKQIDLLGPLRILTSKQAAPIIIFLAIYYAVWQMSITAMSTLFHDRYGLSETHIGLTFIANGVGSMIGTLITGKILDIDYRRVKAKYTTSSSETGNEEAQTTPEAKAEDENDFPLEKARLRLVPIFALAQCVSIAVFGWSVHYPQVVHIAVPIISTFVTGWTAVATQSVVMTYLVDIFSDRSAAASASLNLLRCLFAAGGTSFVMIMVNKIGAGLAFTVCIAAQVVGLLGFAVQWLYGRRWRSATAAKA